MFRFVWLFFGMLVRLFRGRQSLLLENLALRQQLGRAETSTSSPESQAFRSALLGGCSAGLVGLEAVPHPGHAGNRRPLPPDWFSYVLGANFQSPEAGRKETDAEGDSRADLPDGR